MAASRLLYVADTSILIDLQEGEILDAAVRLPVDWLAPDVVIAELAEATAEELKRRGLRECELSGDQVLEVVQLASLYLRPSRTDLFALVLAQATGAVLLTGDKALRTAAEKEGVVVHGILWLLDQIVEQLILTEPDAAAALERMVSRGSHLPHDAVVLRLQWWRRGV